MVNKLKGLFCLALTFMFGLKIDFGQFMYNRLGVSYMIIGGAITLLCLFGAIHYLFPYPKYIEDDDDYDDDNNNQRNAA